MHSLPFGGGRQLPPGSSRIVRRAEGRFSLRKVKLGLGSINAEARSEEMRVEENGLTRISLIGTNLKIKTGEKSRNSRKGFLP